MPSILFSVLALLSAFLPPDSGERLGFGVTLVLAREFCKAMRRVSDAGRTLTQPHTPLTHSLPLQALVQRSRPSRRAAVDPKTSTSSTKIFTTLPVVVTLVMCSSTTARSTSQRICTTLPQWSSPLF